MGNGILEVQLLDARGLRDADIFDKMDPYVLIKYGNQEKKSNVARDEGSNPVWNETFKFRAQHPGSESQHKVYFQIMDHDTFSRDDFVGQATVYVSHLIELGIEEGFSELPPTKYNVVLEDQTYRGSIRVSMTFTKKKEHDNLNVGEIGGWKDSLLD